MKNDIRFNNWQSRVINRLSENNPGWSCIDRLAGLLAGYMAGEEPPSFGENEDYWSFILDEEVEGSCQFGSCVQMDVGRIEVHTCGGHWVVAAALPYGGTMWMTDTKPSSRSWGDTDDPEGLSLGLTEEEILTARVGRFSK
jgi:hypothetical protein